MDQKKAKADIISDIAKFRLPFEAMDIYMSLVDDRNVGFILKLQYLLRSHNMPIEIWLQPIVGKNGFRYMIYRNINLVRYFPTASMLRSGFPQYRETNGQPGFKKTLKSFNETGFKDLMVDWDFAVEANEYRRQIPDFNTACVLRQRMYV